MNRRRWILGLAALALAPVAARAAGKPPVKLAKAFPYLEKYLALPPAERDRFTLAYSFRLDGRPAADLKAAIVQADGRRTPLPVGPDGRAGRLPTAAELQTAMLALEVPVEAKMSINLDIVPLAAPAREMSPHDLALAIAQANAGMAKAVGLLSFAAPRLVAVGFPGAAGGVAVMADGRQVPLPMAGGAQVYDPARFAGATRLVFARAPTRLTFSDKS